MGELVATLLPEIVGMAITPAAVIACLILLGSPHRVRDVTLFAGVFLVNYALISAVVLAAGRAAAAEGAVPSDSHAWVGLVVGLLFLAGGVLTWVRHPKTRAAPGEPPRWTKSLQDPSVSLVLAAAAVLSVVNPNVAILVSGLTAIVEADVSVSGQVAGVALLIAGSMVDFVLPSLAYAVSGDRGRQRLVDLTAWLARHNRSIGIGVLVAFGTLFSVRAIVQLSS